MSEEAPATTKAADVVKEAASTAVAADGAATVPAKLKKRLVRQIEFYFGDSNFRTDRFLSGKAKENPEGYVSIELLLTFQRMKQLTTDVAVVAAALSDCTFSFPLVCYQVQVSQPILLLALLLGVSSPWPCLPPTSGFPGPVLCPSPSSEAKGPVFQNWWLQARCLRLKQDWPLGSLALHA